MRQFATKSTPVGEARAASSSAPMCSKTRKLPDAPLPDECCGRGCANCVWIDYADELMELFEDGGVQEARRIIEEKVEDVNLRTYLLMELRRKT
uniref:Oxidoreductase-like domain-containing protein n=1 Tax=Steinernema glaseri TaxID=37863 RepID=A0A1I7YF99_9BILA